MTPDPPWRVRLWQTILRTSLHQMLDPPQKAPPTKRDRRLWEQEPGSGGSCHKVTKFDFTLHESIFVLTIRRNTRFMVYTSIMIPRMVFHNSQANQKGQIKKGQSQSQCRDGQLTECQEQAINSRKFLSLTWSSLFINLSPLIFGGRNRGKEKYMHACRCSLSTQTLVNLQIISNLISQSAFILSLQTKYGVKSCSKNKFVWHAII